MGPNEMGEIAANTPFLMGGYLNKPEVGLLYLIFLILLFLTTPNLVNYYNGCVSRWHKHEFLYLLY